LRVNATTVTCNHLTANLPGNLGRTLDVGNGHLIINGDMATGQYDVLDLRGSNLNFITPGPDAKIQFTGGTGYLAVQTGDVPKELPDLLFESIPASPAAGPADIDIHTSNTTNRITFRGIRITRATGTEMYVKGSCPKTYKGALVFPEGFNRNSPDERAFNGTNNPVPDNNIFAGPVTFGNNCGVSFYNNNTFLSTVTFGTGSTGGVVFRDHNVFGDKVTIAGTKDTSNAVQFSGTNRFLSGAELTITATTGIPARKHLPCSSTTWAAPLPSMTTLPCKGRGPSTGSTARLTLPEPIKRQPSARRPGPGSSAGEPLRAPANPFPGPGNKRSTGCSGWGSSHWPGSGTTPVTGTTTWSWTSTPSWSLRRFPPGSQPYKATSP
jgi:hypothetical protein